MSESTIEEELLGLTHQLLDCISGGDWEKYQALCDPALTAFEEETQGHLVAGLDFHRFYFDLGGHLGRHQNSIAAPHVRLLGDAAAVVSYVRLVQSVDGDGNPQSAAVQETRVWQRIDGRWQHVHFHRSR